MYPKKKTVVGSASVEDGLVYTNAGGPWLADLTESEMKRLKSSLRDLPAMLENAWKHGQKAKKAAAKVGD